ncbi:MAG: YidH family protein [Planctomycetia bacterium]
MHLGGGPPRAQWAMPKSVPRRPAGRFDSHVDAAVRFFAMADQPVSLTNELARERNREAADRTLLAWIRTSLAMISLGFGIERLGQVAIAFDGRMTGFSPLKTRLFGAALIALGIAATVAGMWEHRRVLDAVSRDDYRYSDRPPIARYMGVALVIIGIAALALMLVHFSAPEIPGPLGG